MRKVIILYICCLAIQIQVYSQNHEYRVFDSPAGSWNGIQAIEAASLGAGGISFFSSSPFSGTIHPALIHAKDTLEIGINARYFSHDAFQYAGINAGVWRTETSIEQSHAEISSLAAAFRIGAFKINIGWQLSNHLAYPDFEFRNDYDYEQYDLSSGNFYGSEKKIFAAVGIDISDALTLAARTDYSFGEYGFTTRLFSSYYYQINGSYVRIDKSTRLQQANRFRQLIPSLGMQLRFDNEFRMALTLQIPINGSVSRQMESRFDNDISDIHLSNSAENSDPCRSPISIITGIEKVFRFSIRNRRYQQIRLALESRYIFWKGHRSDFFNESLEHPLSNSFVPAIGIEYSNVTGKLAFHVRSGFRLDPQPLIAANCDFKIISGGIGIRFGRYTVDLGTAYWSGDCNGVKRNNLVLCGTLNLSIGRQ